MVNEAVMQLHSVVMETSLIETISPTFTNLYASFYYFQGYRGGFPLHLSPCLSQQQKKNRVKEEQGEKKMSKSLWRKRERREKANDLESETVEKEERGQGSAPSDIWLSPSWLHFSWLEDYQLCVCVRARLLHMLVYASMCPRAHTEAC